MKRIGEILVGARAITEKVRDETLAYMKTHRVGFGSALLETGAISEDALLRALSVQSGAPPVSARDLVAVSPDLVRLVPAKLAEKHSALPFRKVGRTLYIAMAHPADNPGGDEIAFLTGLSVVRHVAVAARVAVALEKYYGVLASQSHKALVAKLDGPAPAARAPAPAAPSSRPEGAAETPVAGMLPSGMFRIPLSDGPADPWKMKAEHPERAADERIVLETVSPARKSRSVPEPLDFIPVESDDEEPESAGVPIPEPPPRHPADPRDALRAAEAPGKTEGQAPRQKAPSRTGRPEAGTGDLATKLGSVEETEHVGIAVLESLRQKLDTAALFLVAGDRVTGWLARPEPELPPKDFSVPFSEPSLFSGLRNTTGFFAGPCPDTEANRRILEAIGLRYPAVVGVVPVTIRGKTVLYLVGEAIGGSQSLQIPFLRRHAAMTGIALEILALRKKLAAF